MSGGFGQSPSFSIDYANPDFIDKRSGMLVITDSGSVDPKSLEGRPLALQSTTLVGGKFVIQMVLEEKCEGLSMRSDQFVFRMNPGMQTTPTFPRGETNTVDIYLRKFGRVEGTDGLKVGLSTLTPDQATKYTLGTLGTSGTNLRHALSDHGPLPAVDL